MNSTTTAKWLNKTVNMGAYTQILYQIVFSDKDWKRKLSKENRPERDFNLFNHNRN